MPLPPKLAGPLQQGQAADYVLTNGNVYTVNDAQPWCSGPASFGGKGMSRWPLLLKHLSYSPVNPLDSFYTWRESTDPTFSNSLD